MSLHVDRPCQVCRGEAGGWVWRCMCSPQPWPYTATARSWAAAFEAADEHVRIVHPISGVTTLAALPSAMDELAEQLRQAEHRSARVRELV